MTYRIIYNGKWDYRRFNRDWKALWKLSESWQGIVQKIEKEGDAALLLILGDIAEELGFEMLAKLLHDHGYKVITLGTLRGRRKRRR